MKVKFLLAKHGVFAHFEHGINGHNRSEVLLWRAVLDQSLRDSICTNTSAGRDAYEWVTSPPGTTKVLHDEDGEFSVDIYTEFCEVCDRAGFTPDFVREKWLDLYNRMLLEEQGKGNTK